MATHSAVGRLAAVLTITIHIAELGGNDELIPLAFDGLPCSRPQLFLYLTYLQSLHPSVLVFVNASS